MNLRPSAPTLLLASLLLGLAVRADAASQPAARPPAAPRTAAQGNATPATATPSQASTAIVAIVNGDVISRGDVENRRRLFAMSTGMPTTSDVLDRLTPQVTRQLIDERLKLQETQRRKIVVSDKEIAAAIEEVEKRNNMAPGTLRRRLSTDNIDLRTLIDQLRVQIGWARVLRQVMAGGTEVTDADLAEQANLFKAQTGQPEYRLGEIFVPVSDPAKADEAKQFSDTIIQQLRAGAAFAIVAAQFSQNQTALQGGDLGWVDQTQIDPEVLRVVKEMPVGAISNPIRVPGGYSIVTLRAKREIGRDIATMLSVRQVFFPFATKLDPANPTEQQRQALEASKKLSASAKSCPDMEEAQKKTGSDKPADPGDIRLEGVSVPALRQVLATLPTGKASQPLVAEDGIAVIMVCSRDEKNIGVPSKQELTEKIVNERAELASRQLQRDLQRRAVIDQRS